MTSPKFVNGFVFINKVLTPACMKKNQHCIRVIVYAVVAASAFVACTGKKEEAANTFQVPVEYYKLKNGLKVVLSEDKTAPTVTVAVYYNIGFRIEPKDRTGFAHLFEHMMFQGSKNLPKGEFDKITQRNGG